MSCALVFLDRDNLFIGSDTALSVKTKDGYRRVNGFFKKSYIFNNHIYFVSGEYDSAMYFNHLITHYYPKDFILGKLKDLKPKIEILDCYFDIFPTVDRYAYQNDFEEEKIVSPNGVYMFSVGYKTQECYDYALTLFKAGNSIQDIYKKTFSHLVCDCIGETLDIFTLDKSGPKFVDTYGLTDTRIKRVACSTGYQMLIADTIVGNLIAGNNLVIANSTDKGEATFYVDAEGAKLTNSSLSFKRDNSDAYITIDIDNGIVANNGREDVFNFDILDGSLTIRANELTITGQTMEEISQNTAEDVLKDYADTVTEQINDLQTQIDGQLQTWFYNYIPTNSNYPANSWTTSTEKNNHIGDLFYVTGDSQYSGRVYHWVNSGGSYLWEQVEDAETAQALEIASKAQDTADGKRRVFVTTPTPPYDVGDLWSQGPNGSLLVCKRARSSGYYTASDWQDSSNYIDSDTAGNIAQDAVNGQTQEDIFNKLTNNGAMQGIYMQDNQLYINASYMQSGVIKSRSGNTTYNLNEGYIISGSTSGTRYEIYPNYIRWYTTNGGTSYLTGVIYSVYGESFIGANSTDVHYGWCPSNLIGGTNFGSCRGVDVRQGGDDNHSQFIVNTYSFDMTGRNGLNVSYGVSCRTLNAWESKPRVVKTSYGITSITALESPKPSFCDYGYGEIEEDGSQYIMIDPRFLETIYADEKHCYFFQTQDGSQVTYEEINNGCIVHGTPGTKFNWLVIASQFDTNCNYAEITNDVPYPIEPNPAEDLANSARYTGTLYADEVIDSLLSDLA